MVACMMIREEPGLLPSALLGFLKGSLAGAAVMLIGCRTQEPVEHSFSMVRVL